MSDSAATGGDPETVDTMAHQTATNDAVADAPVYNTDTSALAGRDAEVTEEQHLDDRHATGEHFTGGDANAENDPLAALFGENAVDGSDHI